MSSYRRNKVAHKVQKGQQDAPRSTRLSSSQIMRAIKKANKTFVLWNYLNMDILYYITDWLYLEDLRSLSITCRGIREMLADVYAAGKSRPPHSENNVVLSAQYEMLVPHQANLYYAPVINITLPLILPTYEAYVGQHLIRGIQFTVDNRPLDTALAV